MVPLDGVRDHFSSHPDWVNHQEVALAPLQQDQSVDEGEEELIGNHIQKVQPIDIAIVVTKAID